MCFETGKYCTKCHDSPQNSYYNSYYSTYYSDWYADYYANYYTDALENIDTVHHPLGHRFMSALPIGMHSQGWNEGAMKKLKKVEIAALGAANKGPVVPQMDGLGPGLADKEAKTPWWKRVLDAVVAGAKAFVGGILGGGKNPGAAGQAAANAASGGLINKANGLVPNLPGGGGVAADGAKEAVTAVAGLMRL